MGRSGAPEVLKRMKRICNHFTRFHDSFQDEVFGGAK